MRTDSEREVVFAGFAVDSEFVRRLVVSAVAIGRAKAELYLVSLGEVSRVKCVRSHTRSKQHLNRCIETQ